MIKQRIRMWRSGLMLLLVVIIGAIGLAFWQPWSKRPQLETTSGSADTSSNNRNGSMTPGKESLGEQGVKLDDGEVKELGVETAPAAAGPITVTIERMAEVRFDDTRVVRIVPRASGVASQIDAAEGQNVVKDQLMAILESRELAELKAAYLAAYARRDLVAQTFDRESRLFEKKISSEKEFLDAKAALAEADIAFNVSVQKLRAIGLSQQTIALLNSTNTNLARYEVRAPMAGIVTKRNVSLGEVAGTEKPIFVIADPTSIWVDITIYPRDMNSVRSGQEVQIHVGDSESVRGKVAFVTSHVSEETRTAVARVILDDAGGHLKPGMFVTANIDTGAKTAAVRVPKDAVQMFANKAVVFVKEGDKFSPRSVALGLNNSEFAEIRSGLKPDEIYVTKGAFDLKSLILKSQMGEGG